MSACLPACLFVCLHGLLRLQLVELSGRQRQSGPLWSGALPAGDLPGCQMCAWEQHVAAM
jgi:hypothetical protein